MARRSCVLFDLPFGRKEVVAGCFIKAIARGRRSLIREERGTVAAG